MKSSILMQNYAQNMQDLSTQAVDMARQLEVALDYSKESVQKLEEILEVYHQQLSVAKPSEEEISEMAVVWGAYLGECIRRCFGGEWEFYQNSDAIKLNKEYVFVSSKTRRRICNGSEDSVRSLFNSLERTNHQISR